jgi:hypothetical protein
MGFLLAFHLALMSDLTPAPKLSGGFIQLSNAAMDLKPGDWLNVCDAMKAIEFDSIVVQGVEFIGDDGVLFTFYEKDGIDPIAEMIRLSESRGMKVYGTGPK